MDIYPPGYRLFIEEMPKDGIFLLPHPSQKVFKTGASPWYFGFLISSG